MSKYQWWVTGCLGCLTLVLLLAVVAIPLVVVPLQVQSIVRSELRAHGSAPAAERVPAPLPSLPPGAQAAPPVQLQPGAGPDSLATLYGQVNPGVVNIQVYIARRGQGAGSGFILDEQGHIITNNHVVAQADALTVVFYDGAEAEATIVGTDPDSDLAVIRVDHLPPDTHALPLGDSDGVVVGESVIAIGNPFGLGSSMTAGIVSAIGRTIPSGATPFSIPHAIQTDAAINPGNSGGPLLNLRGEVVGVNAQIATGGAQANAGVGFAIPSNIVRRVAPVLIEEGAFRWPWLGVTGGAVSMALAQANGLGEQQGAYIHEVDPRGPALTAGLQGSTGSKLWNGSQVPTGGDIIIAVDGRPVVDFDGLLVEVAGHNPGDRVELTILRDGQRQTIGVTLAARPASTP